jgi:hypothetical protein
VINGRADFRRAIKLYRERWPNRPCFLAGKSRRILSDKAVSLTIIIILAAVMIGIAWRQENHPRVQLLTVDGLLNGRQRAEHPDYEPDLNFKKARAESEGEQPKLI